MHYQDLGRYGWSHLGVSQGGAIDEHAHCWANYLLENDKDAVTLEISLGNVLWEVLADGEISLTGAEMNVKLDGETISNWSTHLVRKGQMLSLSYAIAGCHAYLGVKRGFKVEKTLGSCSTVVRNEMGTWIKEGEIIVASSAKRENDMMFGQKLTPADYVPNYNDINKIRVIIPDALEDEFSEMFFERTYQISPESDRMGRRLEVMDKLPEFGGILSEGVSLGCIQLPPSGKPIVLLSDRQTQGGYAKIANVVRVDLPKFVQMRPGTEFCFLPVSSELATYEWREFVDFFGL